VCLFHVLFAGETWSVELTDSRKPLVFEMKLLKETADSETVLEGQSR